MAKSRIRMTQRNAAQPPASYGWEPEHPAHKADPEVDDYLIDNDGNGTGSEPSDFAEDVAPGPYAQGPAPASYGWDPDHPAAKADAKGAAPSEKKAAMQRKAAERKAAKCIRIAQALLGKAATAETVEDQAVDFMDLTRDAINATMDRLSAAFLADDEGDEDDKEAYSRAQNDPELGYGGKEADAADMVAEELLAAMLAEEGEPEPEPEATLFAEEDEPVACGMEAEAPEGLEAGDDEVEAMLAEMLAPEADALDEALEEEAPLLEDDGAPMGAPMDDMGGEIGLEMVADEDPMGLGDQIEANDDLLAQLFGGKTADDEDADEGDDDADEGDDDADADEGDDEGGKEAAVKQASAKKANLKPKARKASKGAKSLGTVTKQATSEVNDLSKLWAVAPDVSDVFGN